MLTTPRASVCLESKTVFNVYKPAPGHFATARGRIAPQRWLHAAQSYFHDIVSAVAHNIPVAWINWKGERVTGATWPDREFRTLSQLADWLA